MRIPNYTLTTFIFFILLISHKLPATAITFEADDHPTIIQTDSLDLSFSEYQLVTFSNKNIKKSSDNTRTISINIEGGLSVHLVPSEIIASDFKIERVDEFGAHPAEFDIATPYQGYTNNNPKDIARVTILGNGIYGYVFSNGTKYFIEPANRFDESVNKQVMVVYTEKDIRKDNPGFCGASEVHRKGKELQSTNKNFNNCVEVELAIALDNTYVDARGGPQSAVSQALAIMNMVAGTYDTPFSKKIQFNIVKTVYVEANGNNPWGSTNNADQMLTNFGNWGINNFGVTHDLGQLWTKTDICGDGNPDQCGTIGLAWVNTVCNTTYRYHILEDFNPDAAQLTSLTAHEIGHNFGSSHDTESNSFIMAPYVNSSTTWSTQSINAINNALTNFTCLGNCPESSCDITSITLGDQSACNSTNNTYTQILSVAFENPPSSGHLNVNGSLFNFTTSPLTLILENLPADGQAVDVVAKFTAEESCTKTVNSLFTAPTSCTPGCTITNLTTGNQSDCNPSSNTYSQDIVVAHSNAPNSGQLDVNGQLFTIATSPQTVTLVNLPANGSTVDVTAKFTASTSCTKTTNALFSAPSACSNATCSTFDRNDLSLTISDGAPSSVSSKVTLNGNLSVTDINVLNIQGNHSYFQDLEFSLTGPDNTSAVLFSRNTACNYNVTFNMSFDDEAAAAIVCPPTLNTTYQPDQSLSAFNGKGTEGDWTLKIEDRENGDGGTISDWSLQICYQPFAACEITEISIGNQGDCAPDNNQYTQDVTITYTNAPNSGQLDVNGQTFDITGSPQTVQLTNLTADGGAVNVTAMFTADESCTLTRNTAFTAPENCTPQPCAITSIISGNQTACDPNSNTYIQQIIVAYDNPPETGQLDVNGQLFDFNPDQKMVELVGLIADGNPVNVVAKFTADESCSLTKNNQFTAPENCTPQPCAITSILSGNQTACDPNSNTYIQQIIVVYDNPPATGQLDVNGQLFDFNPEQQMVELVGLIADGNPVNVVAKFTADESCTLTKNNQFTAPENCTPQCNISSLELGNQSDCNEGSNTYTQEIIVTHSNAPNSGQLDVNGQLFDIDNSPQTVTLLQLAADGNSVDVTAKFTANTSCAKTTPSTFTAPASCSSVTCSTFEKTDLALMLGDGAPSSVSSKVTLNGNLSVTDINVLNIQGNHSYFQDLEFSLTGPDNTSAVLFSRNTACNYNVTFNMSFDDEASAAVVCPPALNTTYQPDQSLSAFNGKGTEGDWTLKIEDRENGDGGTLSDWSLQICYQPFAACEITEISIGNQGDCAPDNNQYTQDVTISLY